MNTNYAGAFNVFVSAFDARIRFIDVNPQVSGDGQIVEERTAVCDVCLSLPLAKQLAKHLAEAIAHYETSVSPVVDLDEIKAKE